LNVHAEIKARIARLGTNFFSAGCRRRESAPQKAIRVPQVDYPETASTLTISPAVQSATTSKGRQQTSQSVVNRWLAMLVSTPISQD
jgi:hypothetical protein